MTKKRKKICVTLNYIEHFLILASAVTVCTSISAFSPLLSIPIEITSSEIDRGIKKYRSIVK